MYTKQINIFTNFLFGLGFIAFGIFAFNTNTATLSAISSLFGIAFIVTGIVRFINAVIDNLFPSTEKKASLRIALMNFAFGTIILLTPEIQIAVFGILCGIYAILMGIIRFINYILYRNNKVHGQLLNLFMAIFFISFGVLLLFSPLLGVDTIVNIISTYFILYGLTFIRDSFHELIPNHHQNKIKRKIRISLPVFLVALVPRTVLKEVNHYLEPTHTPRNSDEPSFEQSKSEATPDIEVFIHVTEEGYGSIGHVDLCMGGTVISYGNYDNSSYKLFDSIGDGVIFRARRDQYIPFAIKESKKTLFGFGLRLNEQQKIGVEKKYQEIMENTYEWHPPAYTGDPKIDTYATRMEHEVEVDYYKFLSGKFKTYFVAGTNCVLLSDQIIGGAGIDLLGINGIITPGTYYEYLNKEFASRSDLVISKNIYQ